MDKMPTTCLAKLTTPGIWLILQNQHFKLHNSFLKFAFYLCDTASAGTSDRVVSVCPSVCPSIHPSCTGIVSKPRKLASRFLHSLVAPWFYFLCAKFHHQILRGSPLTGASNKCGV